MMRRIAVLLVSAIGLRAAIVATDSERGAKLFESLACVQCHSVNGRGARVAPDLGRLVDRNFTPATLAATMWNHAPTMWAAMRERKISAGELDEQAAADLFAYFYAARFFDPPGDAGRGKRFFEKGCIRCHGLNGISLWPSIDDPLALAEAMWNHQPQMQAAAGARHMALPQLSAHDLVDVLVYARNLPGRRENRGSFQTTSGAGGQALFQAKGCSGCHRSGSALASRIKGSTLTAIAAAMWNHAPKMSAAGAATAPFEPGEMRELLSYLWAKQFFEDAGDAAHGRRVFAAKRCAGCHGDAASGAPRLPVSGRQFSGAAMVSGLWKHGPAMLETMKKQGTSWPRFEGREMTDLIGYLNSGGAPK